MCNTFLNKAQYLSSMELVPKIYKCHIFVCVNEREEGECCGRKNDSSKIIEQLQEHINKNGLSNKYCASKSKCFGHCAEGPIIAIYPQGHIFKKVTVADTQEIIGRYLQ